MNSHIFKLFAFVFVLVVFVLNPISAKPQAQQMPQMQGMSGASGMPNQGHMADAATMGIKVAKEFGQIAKDNIPNPHSMK